MKNKTEHPPIRMLTDFGVTFSSPNRFGYVEYDSYAEAAKTQSWAHKKRNELLWKLKLATARKNKYKVWVLTMITCIVLLSFTILIVAFAPVQEITSIGLGILCAQLMIISKYFWEERFETDPNWVRIVRRGRKYGLWAWEN